MNKKFVGFLVSIPLFLTSCGIDKSGKEAKKDSPEVQAYGEGADQADGARVSGGNSFVVDEVSLTGATTSKFSKTGMPAEKIFNFKACVSDRISLANIVDRPFKVQGGDEVKNVRTDVKGCLRWSEYHAYNHNDVEVNYEIARVIEGSSIYSGKQKVVLLLNPWQGKIIDTRFSQSTDTRVPTVTGFGGELKGSEASRATLDIKTFQCQILGYLKNQYSLTQDLRLQVVHGYELKFNVNHLRKTLAGYAVETPLAGRLRVRGYLMKNPVIENETTNEIVASFDNEVAIGPNGLVSGPILFQIYEPMAINVRSYVYLRIDSLDDDSVQPGRFTGIVENITPFPNGVKPVTFDYIDTYEQKIAKIKSPKPGLNLQNFSKIALFVNTEETNSSRLTKLVESLADEDKWQASLRRISQTNLVCDVYASNPDLAKAKERCDCEKIKGSLGRYVNGCADNKVSVNVRDFVHRVLGNPEMLSGPVAVTINVAAKFEKTTSNNVAAGMKTCWSCWGFSGGLNGGFDLSAPKAWDDAVGAATGGLVKLKLGANVAASWKTSRDIYSTTSVEENTNQGTSVGYNQSVGYTGEAYKLGYRAEVARCMTIEIEGMPESKKVVCSKVFERDVQEHQYFLNMTLSRESYITDVEDQDSKKRFIVRGKRAFESLVDRLSNKNLILYYTKAETRKDKAAIDNFSESAVVEEFPGMLVPVNID